MHVFFCSNVIDLAYYNRIKACVPEENQPFEPLLSHLQLQRRRVLVVVEYSVVEVERYLLFIMI